MAMPDRPLISVVTQGELLALVKKFEWGEAKTRQLEDLLQYVTVVDINVGDILRAYAETDDYATRLKPSVRMQKNDLWIASTARALGCTVLTTDTVFDHLHPNWIERIYVDEKVVKPQP